MGSVGFEAQDETQPSTSNGKKCKLPRTVPDNGGAVNHAPVPRKMRSAIKKRARKSVSPHMPISRKQYRMSNGFETLRKDGGKRSKPNMKQGHITKDEEEVAETLYALADMFSDANKAGHSGLNNELPEAKASAKLEAGSSMNAVEDAGFVTPHEESRKMASEFTIGATCSSSILVDSTGKIVKFQSLGDADAQQPELPTNKQPSASSASGNQSENLDPGPRVSTLHMIPSGDQAIVMEQVKGRRMQYDKNSHPTDSKNNGLFLSPDSTTYGALQSETQVSCLRLQESTSSASKPLSIEKVAAEKDSPARIESKKLQKQCPTHIYISHLIKDLKVSEGKQKACEKPTQIASSGGGLHSDVRNHNQMTGTSSRNGCGSFNGTSHFAIENESAQIQNNIPSHNRTLQGQHHASETSAACSSTFGGFDFLSMGAGDGLDPRGGINRTRHEAPMHFHAPYIIQSQSNAAILFSPPQNGYSAASHGHNASLAQRQVQLPQYPGSIVNSSSFTGRLGQQLDSQQQKWATELPMQYNPGGVSALQLSDWKNGGRESQSMLNYVHTLFPHLQSTLGSKYHPQFSHSQQQQLMALNSTPLPISNVMRNHHHLPFGFERSRAAFYQESIPQQLQLPCNQHLSN